MSRYALMGFAESFKEAFADEYADVRRIGINELWKYVPDTITTKDGRSFPGWSEWLEIHDEDSLGITKRALGQDSQEVAAHKAWMERQSSDRPIWTQGKFVDQFPAAREYPLTEVQRRFARYTTRPKWDYLTSTIALGIAMLLIRGRDEDWQIVNEDEACTWLMLAGIDLIGQGEYQHQRPCAEWFIAFCQATGIEVVIPESSALLSSSHIYGYERAPGNDGPMSKARLAARQRWLARKQNDLVRDYHRTRGAFLETQNWITVREAWDRGVTDLPKNFVDEGPAPAEVPTPQELKP